MPISLRNGETYVEKEGGQEKADHGAGTAFGTTALEMLPTFIIGIELKDKEGEKYETEPQNHRSVARLLEKMGAFLGGGIIKLLPQDCSQL